MSLTFKKKILSTIDIGTTKICVLIAQQLDIHNLKVIGIGTAPSDGLHKGVVIHIGKTIQAIKAAVREAETMANKKIESADIGISGSHIRSTNAHGAASIKKGVVRPYDIQAALKAARAISVPEGYQILHVIPQYFIIDGQERLSNPLHMHGIRLEVHAHIILGAISSVKNLIRCCQTAGIGVNDVVLEQIASSAAILNSDEKKLGVAVLDIGGGTTDLALYRYGSIRHSMVIPVAGNHFTQDLAIGLQTNYKEAERIKKEFGCAWPNNTEQKSPTEICYKDIQNAEAKNISSEVLCHIMHARAQELLLLVKKELQDKNLEGFIQAGLVLTGGGSLLNGLVPLGEKIFKKPIRIGTPIAKNIVPPTLISPLYATSYGLLIHALEKQQARTNHWLMQSLYGKIYTQMKTWVSDFF